MNKIELYKMLSDMVLTEEVMTQQRLSDIMMYVLTKENEHSNEISRWIENCNKLLRINIKDKQ